MSATRRPRKRERQERILAELHADPAVRIGALARTFGVSSETVRRDLDELSRDGRVNRTYGGAALPPMGVEPSLNERYRRLVAERARIGRLAATLVAPGEVLMIDAGSTTAQLARRLAAELGDLTVVTNGLGLATILGANPGIRVILCPGAYDAREGAVLGPETTAFLERFHANTALIGASGLTPEGPGEANAGAVWVKRAMIARSQRHVLLVDRSKFDQPSFQVVCPLTALDDLVVDAPPGGALAEAVAAAGIALHVAAA
ncbi:MAG TPA: DeoR/GlpR family DNA-binding transcription regulator [Dongiaceae bacterium]|nr:DeoR/GlpR family DNA-binding transcription regulator [Dongiaceae bacterium]